MLKVKTCLLPKLFAKIPPNIEQPGGIPRGSCPRKMFELRVGICAQDKLATPVHRSRPVVSKQFAHIQEANALPEPHRMTRTVFHVFGVCRFYCQLLSQMLWHLEQARTLRDKQCQLLSTIQNIELA